MLGAVVYPADVQAVEMVLFTKPDLVPQCPGLSPAWFCESSVGISLFPLRKKPLREVGFVRACLVFSVCLRASKSKLMFLKYSYSFPVRKGSAVVGKGGMHVTKVNYKCNLFSD